MTNEPVRRRVVVACAPDHAFRVFTTHVDLWWPPSHRRREGCVLRFEPGVGGRFLEVGPGETVTTLGEVLDWQPPHRLTYTWVPGSPLGPTTVEVAFHDDGGRTVVELVHHEGSSGLGDRWPGSAERFHRAWDTVLPAFQRAAEAPPVSSV